LFTHCTHLSWCDLTFHFRSISSHLSHSRNFRACWWRTSWELALKSCWNFFLSKVLLNLCVPDPHWKVSAGLVARRRGLCYRSWNGILVQIHNRVMEDLPWFLDSGETEIVFWLREPFEFSKSSDSLLRYFLPLILAFWQKIALQWQPPAGVDDVCGWWW
jgi:hypothetical protein